MSGCTALNLTLCEKSEKIGKNQSKLCLFEYLVTYDLEISNTLEIISLL